VYGPAGWSKVGFWLSCTCTTIVQLEELLEPSVTVHIMVLVPEGNNLPAKVLDPSKELVAVTGHPSLVVGSNSVPITV